MSKKQETTVNDKIATPETSAEQSTPKAAPAAKPAIAPAPKNSQPHKKTTGKESFSRIRSIVGVLLIISAIVVAVLLVPLLSGRDTATYKVVYAKTDVPAGVQITKDNINDYFEAREIIDANVYKTGINGDEALKVLENCFTRRTIYKGKMAYPDDFSKTNVIYNDKVPEGKVLIGLDIPSLEGNVGYMPKAGDIIKIYRMVEYSYEVGDIYFDAANIHVPIGVDYEGAYAEPYEYLQYVEIFAAIDGDFQDSDANNTPEAAFVLLVNDGVQAEQIVEAAYSGNYYFSLVSSGDEQRKEAFLNLQDQIIEQGFSGAGREEYVFNLKDITTKDYIPGVKDTVKFSAAIRNDAGKVTVESPAILKYVSVLDVYDANGNSVGLSTDEITEEILQNGSIGLNLTKEQAELIQSFIDNGQLFMTQVVDTETNLIKGFNAVNDAIWADRARYIMNNLNTPGGALADAETGDKDETSEKAK